MLQVLGQVSEVLVDGEADLVLRVRLDRARELQQLEVDLVSHDAVN
jgi:hypothetical protein